MNPSIAVITPVRNGLPFLAEAIESIQSQNYQPLELLIVDDGSTDGTREFLRTRPGNPFQALESNGIGPAPLTTWDAFFAAARKLRVAGVKDPIQMGATWTASLLFEAIMAGQGIAAYEDWINGKITAGELKKFECAACPGAGSCAGMFTANTMSNLSEALGMTLPLGGSAPAVYADRIWIAKQSGQAAVQLVIAGETSLELEPVVAQRLEQRRTRPVRSPDGRKLRDVAR